MTAKANPTLELLNRLQLIQKSVPHLDCSPIDNTISSSRLILELESWRNVVGTGLFSSQTLHDIQIRVSAVQFELRQRIG